MVVKGKMLVKVCVLMEPMLVVETVMSLGKACEDWKKERKVVRARRKGRRGNSQWEF